jgi:hypothetical protein
MAIPRKTTRSMQRPATGAHKPATGSHARPTGRRPAGSSTKSNTPLIIGGAVGGGLLLIVIIAIAASGKSGNTPVDKGGKTVDEKKPVDVRALVESGERKREEGYLIIQGCNELMHKRDLSAAEKSDLKAKLEKGIHLIQDGNSDLDKAKNLNPDVQYEDSNKYGQNLKAAKMKLLEL